MNREIRELLDRQSGVISRRQAPDAGLKPHDIQRLLRRKEWSRVYDGVFVTHTGELTWVQRAWAGVLFAAPAALCGDSVIRASDGPGRRGRSDESIIHVAVDRKRAVVEPPGLRIHQLAAFDERVQWNLSPPRVRIEHALLDVAARKEPARRSSTATSTGSSGRMDSPSASDNPRLGRAGGSIETSSTWSKTCTSSSMGGSPRQRRGQGPRPQTRPGRVHRSAPHGATRAGAGVRAAVCDGGAHRCAPPAAGLGWRRAALSGVCDRPRIESAGILMHQVQRIRGTVADVNR